MTTYLDQASRLRSIMSLADEPTGREPPGQTSGGGGGPGVVSVGPGRSSESSSAPVRTGIRLARAIAVTSGKGGVGKSNLAINMAIALSRFGLKVCLLDADLGLANADVLCNLNPKRTLQHVIAGQCRLSEAMLLAPGGFRLIPGASGVSRLADLPHAPCQALIRQLAALERVADVLVIDCAAGINSSVLSFARAAHTVVVLTTPEPTAMTDAYGTIKSLRGNLNDTDVQLVVNMVSTRQEGEDVHLRMNRVCKAFLGRTLSYGGCVPADPIVPVAVRYRVPYSLYDPEGEAAHAVRSVALNLVGIPEEQPAARTGFVSRLTSWLGGNK